MTRHFLFALIALGMAAATACGQPQNRTGQDNNADDGTARDIGEMLLVGFRGTGIDSTSHIWRDITHYHVGSVILFDYDAILHQRGRNISGKAQVGRLCSQLKALDPDLLIGIDQEGGMVSRLHPRYGFPRIASAHQSAQGGADSVKRCAKTTAKMLHSAGINLNFAPVADVDINPQCPVIGKLGRSFSSQADEVAACCRLWIEAQQQHGVASCLKHFPGHGSASGDTHKGLVDVSSTWQRTELAPYRQLASEVPMVMTAHVINRQLDPSGLPASLSPAITAYLRDSIGFEGVIVTDDLAMGAIVKEYSYEEAIRMAIAAGADMLCLSNNGDTYDSELVPITVGIIRQLLDEGVVTAERIHQSAERIRKMKSRLH